jgi:predicted DNA-binding ribbon-helix-helix protein
VFAWKTCFGTRWKKLARDHMSVPQLLSKLYDELLEHRGDIPNFTSFFARSVALRYVALQLCIPCYERTDSFS